jgi:hypothetical protein
MYLPAFVVIRPSYRSMNAQAASFIVVTYHTAQKRDKDMNPSAHIDVGDAHGVQGRFDDRTGQTLSLIARHQHSNFSFGDFKCTSAAYTKEDPASQAGW